jgi:SAM-dependent methyltransferase
MRQRLSSFESLRYLSVDMDADRADMQGDVTDLQLSDESFDFVLCVHVLEHVPDDRKAISELYRVLRPGGTALLQVPPSALEVTLEDPSVIEPTDRERVFGQYDHVRICGTDYGLRLEEPGFQVRLVDYVAELAPEARERFDLHLGEPFYVCEKPAPAA